MQKPHRVVVVGGGFGGLLVAQSLKRPGIEVTVVDRRNFHLFQPLLYQVATGGLSPANIASPFRAILKKHKNVRVLLGEVIDIDVKGHLAVLRDCAIPYDTLIVATGSQHHYFGNPQWASLAPGLKSIEDATEIRRRILMAFESAEWEPDPVKQQSHLTFVIVGGGPTGVELAGALGEIANATLKSDFRNINPSDARILLLEGADRILPTFSPMLSSAASRSLRRLGVSVRTGATVTDMNAEGLKVRSIHGTETIRCRTVLWAAGVQASPVGKVLASAAGATLDKSGRVSVEPDLSIKGHPEIFVVGDLAHVSGADGQPLPGVAPVAMQEGRYVALTIAARLEGKPSSAFRYHDRGVMATIGRAAAVVDLGYIHFTGYLAWLIWLFIHLMYIVEFENRLLVFLQWAWNYLTRNRSARLITGQIRIPYPETPRGQR
jgi:NADH dehydrogenase